MGLVRLGRWSFALSRRESSSRRCAATHCKARQTTPAGVVGPGRVGRQKTRGGVRRVRVRDEGAWLGAVEDMKDRQAGRRADKGDESGVGRTRSAPAAPAREPAAVLIDRWEAWKGNEIAGRVVELGGESGRELIIKAQAAYSPRAALLSCRRVRMIN